MIGLDVFRNRRSLRVIMGCKVILVGDTIRFNIGNILPQIFQIKPDVLDIRPNIFSIILNVRRSGESHCDPCNEKNKYGGHDIW
jgi:hypothetical protein